MKEMDGILNICKPAGMPSFKCMSIVKRKLGLKKVGFLGTLDPAACGVLVLLCGKATKLQDFLHGRAPHPDDRKVSEKGSDAKVYRSVFTFGIETDTLDKEGAVIASNSIIPTRAEIIKVLPEMIGEIEIEIPRFSAIHINGERAYDLARKGVDFKAPKKVVEIKRFDLLEKVNDVMAGVPLSGCDAPILDANGFAFEVECQTGTYIRSLAKLIAQKLGTVAIASTIIRTRVGQFDIKDSKTIAEVTTGDLVQMS